MQSGLAKETTQYKLFRNSLSFNIFKLQKKEYKRFWQFDFGHRDNIKQSVLAEETIHHKLLRKTLEIFRLQKNDYIKF